MRSRWPDFAVLCAGGRRVYKPVPGLSQSAYYTWTPVFLSSPEVFAVMMLKVVLLLCGAVAFVSADCGLLARQVIKQQWSKAYGFGNDRENFAEEVWHEIFETTPEARAIFDRVRGDNIYSKEFRAHALRVMGGLDMCIGLLDDQAALDAQLAHLKGQHIERKIPDAYFEAMKNALIEVIPQRIGDCFNRDAWSGCLDSLNSAIKGGS